MKHQTVVSPVVEALLTGRANVDSSWVQCNSLGIPFEGHCAMTALPYEGLGFNGALQALSDALPEGRHHSIARYNDLPTTTKADILALYDRAIELALAQ